MLSAKDIAKMIVHSLQKPELTVNDVIMEEAIKRENDGTLREV